MQEVITYFLLMFDIKEKSDIKSFIRNNILFRKIKKVSGNLN